MSAVPNPSTAFAKAFAVTAKHFNMTKQERSVALRYAKLDYWRACRCYIAIARSLGPSPP